jgi:nucleoside-diphosphate-sugar epimerase
MLSVLMSASKVQSVKRVVMTSSCVTLMPFKWLSVVDTETVFTETFINSDPKGPFKSSMEAYWASKAITRMLSQKFVDRNSPNFDIVRILPSVVLGRDERATDNNALMQGTRAVIMGIVLGVKNEVPWTGIPVHVDDVARAHVDALKPTVPGNADYIFTSGDGIDGIEWNSANEIAAELFPEAVKRGILLLGGAMPTKKCKINATATEKVFGWKCQSWRKILESLVGQYVELAKRA